MKNIKEQKKTRMMVSILMIWMFVIYGLFFHEKMMKWFEMTIIPQIQNFF